MNLLKKFFIIFLFLCFTFGLINHATAQPGTIRGFVYEEETGEPVIFTNVYLANTSYGSSTDVNGYFAITRIPEGNYTLLVTYLGFDTLKMEVSVQPDQIITKKLYLKSASYTLGQILVSAEREEAQTETRTSVVKITPKQIKQIPSIGGQPDLAQYLQVLPGVIFTGDQGGQLYIRGGSPVQNKVLLDGMIIYNPFHSIGLFSVFDTEILRNADVYTGGFGSEYGGRISSVMDITTRDGNKNRFAGKAGMSTFGANLMVEGPIKKQKDGEGGSSSFILSAKHSYLEQSSKIFYEYINEDGLPFNYTDLYGKVSLLGVNGSKVNFFGFNFTDRVNNYRALSDYSWKSFGGGTNFVVIPGSSPILLEGRIAYSQYKIALEEESFPPR
ncbi:MAG: TonB-dependent receptor, partial [Bacteroidales bacterium]|nr:TonB-dependent receptor [Bacteroidales bacterium]